MGQKVLVVDDDVGVLEVIRETLESQGYFVTLADDGHTAKEFLGINTYDLVLVDLEMPKVTGLELLTWLRDFNKVKVILITASAQGIERNRAESMANTVLMKPFTPHALVEIVERELKK